MTPRDLIAATGWTQREFARRIGRPQSTVRRWIDGTAAMPPAIAVWLEAVAAAIAALPPHQ